MVDINTLVVGRILSLSDVVDLKIQGFRDEPDDAKPQLYNPLTRTLVSMEFLTLIPDVTWRITAIEKTPLIGVVPPETQQ